MLTPHLKQHKETTAPLQLGVDAFRAPETPKVVAVQQDCAKCRKTFVLEELYKKSANRYLCAGCNKLSTFLCRLDLPDTFRQLGSDEMCAFFRNVSKMQNSDGKLSLQKVSTQVQLALETTVENSSTSSLGGDYLPLSVLAMQGWDPKLVEAAGIRREDPKLGTVYKMEVLSEKVAETQGMKRKESTTVNMRARKTRRACLGAEEPELVSSDDEREDKAAKKERQLREKAQLKTFKKDTGTASKAVSTLGPLVLQVKDEAKTKATQLLTEAKDFLARGCVDAALSFELAHVNTEASLLRTEAKSSAASKKKAKAKAKNKAKDGNTACAEEGAE